MRFTQAAILPTIGALMLLAHPASAQVTVTARIGQPQYEVRVSPYATEADGDWRTNFTRWQTATVYSVDGHFYSRAQPGARPVSVYRYQNEYFLPPRDRGFENFDRRYNYDSRPVDGDFNIVEGVASLFGLRPERTWGNEVFISTYSPDAQGDWRTNYRRWQPVTLYNRNGRYFSNTVPGARAVSMYRWQNQYFLPPTDDQWRNSDPRYDYGRAPTPDDYNNPQRNPGQYNQPRPGQYGPAPTTGFGNEVGLTVYTPEVHGEWRTTYDRWETATLYSLNGKYYPNQVPGSRSLMVYRSNSLYFLPPQDRQWERIDRRYDLRMRPTDDDYNAALHQAARRP